MARSAKNQMADQLVEAARVEARTMSIEELDRKIEAARVKMVIFDTAINHETYSALKAVRAGREV